MSVVKFFVFLFILINCIKAVAIELPPDTTFVPPKHTISLSLNEAILLAVRSNPNVQSTELSYVSQKFNLWVNQWEFLPHYSFQTSAEYVGGGGSSVVAQPAVSLLTPIGTQLSLGASNHSPGLSLQVMQPLMRGFGKAIVQTALNNARDSDIISRLNIESVLRTTITSVINAYLDVVNAEQTIQIDEQALARAQKSVEQTKLYIKAGHKAGNELVTVQANAASARTQLINDRNVLLQARYALLTAIGIDPNAAINFKPLDVNKLIAKYTVPPLEHTKYLTLENDIQYQIDQITLHGSTTRALFVAEDNARWQLNFNANVASGNGIVSHGGIHDWIGSNQARSIGLTLQIPINDQTLKQAVLNAKIALRQAELGLMQVRWSKETSAINAWHNVESAKSALYFAQDAEVLQLKTYNISYQKYLHGLIDSLELQTAQVQLIQAQQTSLTARINYLKSLVNLDLLIGRTLRTWNIQARFG